MRTNKNKLPSYFLAPLLLFWGLAAYADILSGYSVLETITYEYDASGNLIARSATVSGVPETPVEAQYDAGNRLTQLTFKGRGSNGTDLACVLAYDPNGNLQSKTCGSEITQYTWDSRDRLIQIQSPVLHANFKYDALGRRVERTINGGTLQYLYDGDQAIAEIRNGAVSAHLLTGLAIDEIIARYTTGDERTLLTDVLGSILIATKEDTSVATAYGYSSYGETQIMGTEEQNPLQYTARENDGTGLYYYRARYYDPEFKRFISEDPISINGGINIYAYVEGSPMLYRDPFGLKMFCLPGMKCWSDQLPIEVPKKDPAFPKDKKSPDFCAQTMPTYQTCFSCCVRNNAFKGSACREQCSHREPTYPDTPYETELETPPSVCSIE